MTPMGNWTAGPWVVEQLADMGWRVRPASGLREPILGAGWGAANARLISAAPELYDALCEARGYVEYFTRNGPDEDGKADALEDRIIAALAKARGA